MRDGKRFLVAANWKMNKTVAEALDFAEKFAKPRAPRVEAVVCPPFTALHALSVKLKGSGVSLGGQNVFYEDSGTFTGEVSPLMLKEMCSYVIVGHSERRSRLGETDAAVARKLAKALEHGLRPILCVGETQEEKEAGKGKDVVSGQLRAALSGLAKGSGDGLEIAYEPLWAISKGAGDQKTQTATPEDAQKMHAFIRGVISGMLGGAPGRGIRILYGGSVKADNVAGFAAMPDVDGVLVGGASLDPEAFSGIIRNSDSAFSPAAPHKK